MAAQGGDTPGPRARQLPPHPAPDSCSPPPPGAYRRSPCQEKGNIASLARETWKLVLPTHLPARKPGEGRAGRPRSPLPLPSPSPCLSPFQQLGASSLHVNGDLVGRGFPGSWARQRLRVWRPRPEASTRPVAGKPRRLQSHRQLLGPSSVAPSTENYVRASAHGQGDGNSLARAQKAGVRLSEDTFQSSCPRDTNLALRANAFAHRPRALLGKPLSNQQARRHQGSSREAPSKGRPRRRSLRLGTQHPDPPGLAPPPSPWGRGVPTQEKAPPRGKKKGDSGWDQGPDW